MSTPQKPSVKSPSPSKLFLPAFIIILVVLILAGTIFYSTSQKKSFTKSSNSNSPIINNSPVPSTQNQTPTTYKNGEFTATGTYISPAGQHPVSVTVDLENNIITQVEASAQADDLKSKFYQKEFLDHYQNQVVGQNIDTLHLTIIAGSSLTPIGFNDALEKIKTAAHNN